MFHTLLLDFNQSNWWIKWLNVGWTVIQLGRSVQTLQWKAMRLCPRPCLVQHPYQGWKEDAESTTGKASQYTSINIQMYLTKAKQIKRRTDVVLHSGKKGVSVTRWRKIGWRRIGSCGRTHAFIHSSTHSISMGVAAPGWPLLRNCKDEKTKIPAFRSS